jgi:hypothetical protein
MVLTRDFWTLSRRLAALPDTKELPISSIIMEKSELEAAVSNISRGHAAVTEGPVEVAYLPKSRKYQLTNGYHRMVALMLAGETRVLANIHRGDWALPSRRERFTFQPELPFKGLEDFIEIYLLRRL